MLLHELGKNTISKQDTGYELRSQSTQGSMKSWYRSKELPMHIDGLECYFVKDTHDIYVTVWDKQTMVALLSLEGLSYMGQTVYSVERAGVAKEYQGQGIGWALYQGLITLCGVTLCSNGTHSKGAQKLWAALAADPKIGAFAVTSQEDIHFIKPKGNEMFVPALKKSIYQTKLAAILTAKSGKLGKQLAKMASEKRQKKDSGQDIFGVKNTYRWNPT